MNSRPMTDASWSVFFGASSSRSMRAMITSWIVSGMTTSSRRRVSTHSSPTRRSAPTSWSDLMTSSMKKGLPSALPRMSGGRSSGRRPVASTPRAISTLASAGSAVRAMRVWYVRSPKGCW